MKKQFEIQSKGTGERGYNDWSADYVGNTDNQFDSVEEAEAAIESLKQLGDEWATAEYRIVEIER